MGSKKKPSPTKVEHDVTPEWAGWVGSLVVIEKGIFDGWVGLFDDEDGRRAVVYPMYPLHCRPYTMVGFDGIRLLTEVETRIDRERSKAPNAMTAACLADAIKLNPNLPSAAETTLDVQAMAFGLPYREVSEERLGEVLKPFALFVLDRKSGKIGTPPSLEQWIELHGIFQLLTRTAFAPPEPPVPAPSPAVEPPTPRPAVFTPGLAMSRRRRR